MHIQLKLTAMFTKIQQLNSDSTPESNQKIDEICKSSETVLKYLKDGILETYTMINNQYDVDDNEESKAVSSDPVQKSNQEESDDDTSDNDQLTYYDPNCQQELERVRNQFDDEIRIELPAKRKSGKLHFFSILKNFIGKDLTRFSLPISLNEPLSLLQRMSELARFLHLLDTAALAEDPYLKQAFVIAYA